MSSGRGLPSELLMCWHLQPASPLAMAETHAKKENPSFLPFSSVKLPQPLVTWYSTPQTCCNPRVTAVITHTSVPIGALARSDRVTGRFACAVVFVAPTSTRRARRGEASIPPQGGRNNHHRFCFIFILWGAHAADLILVRAWHSVPERSNIALPYIP